MMSEMDWSKVGHCVRCKMPIEADETYYVVEDTELVCEDHWQAYCLEVLNARKVN